VSPEELSNLAGAVSQLKWWALAFLTLWVLIWRGFAFLEQRAKRERAQTYSNALAELAGSMSKHDAALDEMAKSVKEMTRKSKGTMPLDSTLSIIETFYSNIIYRAQSIIEQSLRENDYANRAQYISRKVRTMLADFIYGQREELRKINTLAVDPDQFFRVYINDDTKRIQRVADNADSQPASDAFIREVQGERFILCDIIWRAVEPCYTGSVLSDDDIPLQGRIEEAHILLQNAVHDHYTHISTKIAKDMQSALGGRDRGHGHGSGGYKRVRSDH